MKTAQDKRGSRCTWHGAQGGRIGTSDELERRFSEESGTSIPGSGTLIPEEVERRFPGVVNARR